MSQDDEESEELIKQLIEMRTQRRERSRRFHQRSAELYEALNSDITRITYASFWVGHHRYDKDLDPKLIWTVEAFTSRVVEVDGVLEPFEYVLRFTQDWGTLTETLEGILRPSRKSHKTSPWLDSNGERADLDLSRVCKVELVEGDEVVLLFEDTCACKRTCPHMYQEG